MSSGNVHLNASLILAAGFSVAAIVSSDARIFECAFGSLVGIFVSPDLDLSNGGIVSGKMIRKKVGWFGESVWKLFWRGYSDSFKHGTWASHSVPFGTFMRLAYIYYWFAVIPSVFGLLIFPNLNLMRNLELCAKIIASPLFVYGLCSSDFIHIVLDKLTKEKS